MSAPRPLCSIADCENKSLARGWCNKHYLAWRNHGDPLARAAAPRRTPTIVRFLSKVSNSGDPVACWEWTGGHDKDGYGIFWAGDYQENGHPRYMRTPRWAHEQFIGPIPAGHHVLHRCDNPPCVNPAHLFTGTDLDNHADREAKGRGRPAHARL